MQVHRARGWSTGVLAVVALLVLGGCTGEGGTDATASSTGTDRQAEWELILAAEELRHQCMADLGYVVGENEQGRTTIQPMAGDEGDEQFFADLEACAEKHPLPPIAPRSREELTRLYEAQLERARCIEGHGYETVPPPSLDTYVAELQKDPRSVTTPPWDPLSPSLVGAAGIELQELCPRPSIYTLDQ